jgi:hypothetical protein
VLEIPTPRWSTYDSARNGLPLSGDVLANYSNFKISNPLYHNKEIPYDKNREGLIDSLVAYV